MNFIIALVILVLAVVVGFWAVGMLIGVLPAIAITFLRVAIVLVALVWLYDRFSGRRPLTPLL